MASQGEPATMHCTMIFVQQAVGLSTHEKGEKR